MLAAILGAALVGIEDEMDPGQPLEGNAYEQDLPQLADSWETAIQWFEDSPLIRKIFPDLLIENLCNTKRQELAHLADMPDTELWKIYLESV